MYRTCMHACKHAHTALQQKRLAAPPSAGRHTRSAQLRVAVVPAVPCRVCIAAWPLPSLSMHLARPHAYIHTCMPCCRRSCTRFALAWRRGGPWHERVPSATAPRRRVAVQAAAAATAFLVLPQVRSAAKLFFSSDSEDTPAAKGGPKRGGMVIDVEPEPEQEVSKAYKDLDDDLDRFDRDLRNRSRR